MDRKEAVRLAKRIAKPIVDGEAISKYEAIDQLSKEDQDKILQCVSFCPLCEYARFEENSGAWCDICPYLQKYQVLCGDFPSYEENPFEFAQLIMELED
jgi:hypothetical protein